MAKTDDFRFFLGGGAIQESSDPFEDKRRKPNWATADRMALTVSRYIVVEISVPNQKIGRISERVKSIMFSKMAVFYHFCPN